MSFRQANIKLALQYYLMLCNLGNACISKNYVHCCSQQPKPILSYINQKDLCISRRLTSQMLSCLAQNVVT